MIRLRCDDVHKFIDEEKTFYTVNHGHPHKKGHEVILYNDHQEHKFKIVLIQFGTVLSLQPMK